METQALAPRFSDTSSFLCCF